jgi:predicted amidophosphoribosyltransferase
LEQAQALAAELGMGAMVVDALRWSEPLLSASAAGGMRDPQHLLDRLRVVGTFPEARLRYVLVDDVVTSGGHLQACGAMLRAHGQRVELAAVAGRADRTRAAEPFAMRVDVLSELMPRGSHAA